MTKAKTRKARRPHLDFATLLKRTFGIDVWTTRAGNHHHSPSSPDPQSFDSWPYVRSSPMFLPKIPLFTQTWNRFIT